MAFSTAGKYGSIDDVPSMTIARFKCSSFSSSTFFFCSSFTASCCLAETLADPPELVNEEHSYSSAVVPSKIGKRNASGAIRY